MEKQGMTSVNNRKGRMKDVSNTHSNKMYIGGNGMEICFYKQITQSNLKKQHFERIHESAFTIYSY